MAVDKDAAGLTLRDDAVSWAPTDNGSIVVLDLRSSRYLNLNPAASLLWGKVAEGANTAGLVAALVGQFGIDEARAQSDVAAFVADLRARDLLLGAG